MSFQALASIIQQHNEAVESLAMDKVDKASIRDQRLEAEEQNAQQAMWLKRYRAAIAAGDRKAAVAAAGKLPPVLNSAGMRVAPIDRVEKDLELFPLYESHLQRVREIFAASRTARALGKLMLDFRQQMDRIIGAGAVMDTKTNNLNLRDFLPLGFNVVDDLRGIRLEDHRAMEAVREDLLADYPWLRPVEPRTAEDHKDRPRGSKKRGQ